MNEATYRKMHAVFYIILKQSHVRLELIRCKEIYELLVDSHAHLQWASFNKDLEDVLDRAARDGVENVVNVGFDFDGSRKGIELADKYNELYAAVGFHPHVANQLDDNILDELEKLSENRKVVAIGEIGLDYYRKLSPIEVQWRTFITQLSLADKLDLPVIVHNREAHADVVKALLKFKGKIRGVMHCFSGSKDMARQCIKMGFYISFAGSVTYPNSRGLREVVQWIDLNRILLETDCPWLAPQDVRGKRNEPAFLVFTARKIAELKKISLEGLASATMANTNELFRMH